MPVTDYKRFQTIDSQGNWAGGFISALLEGSEGGVIYFTNLGPFPFAIFSNVVSFGVPSNATITGVEGNMVILPNNIGISSTQVWNGKVSLNSLSDSDLTDTLISIDPPATSAAKYTFGGKNDLLGLSLTPSNVDNLRLGFKLVTSGVVGNVLGIVYGEAGDGSTAFDTPAPALRIHYTVPPSPSLEPKTAVRSSGFYVRES